MSVQAIGWALEQEVGSPTRKVVLIALANRVNPDTGICFPSVKTVAKECCLGKSTVIRMLHELEQAGFIQRVARHRENGSQTSNEYRFPPLAAGHPPSRSETPPRPAARPPEPELRTQREELPAAPPRQEPGDTADTKARSQSATGKPNGVPRPKPSRAQCDEVWDTLTDIFGPALTRTAEKHRGQLVQSLAGAGATRDEIMRRAKSWPAHFDRATLTAAALEKHWDTLGRKPLRRTG